MTLATAVAVTAFDPALALRDGDLGGRPGLDPADPGPVRAAGDAAGALLTGYVT